MSHYALDDILGYQDMNDVIDGKGHGTSAAENEVRVNDVGGNWVLQKYISSAWVNVGAAVADDTPYFKKDGTRAMTGNLALGVYYISNDGGAAKGLVFDVDGNATFKQNVDVIGSIKQNGVAGALVPLGGIFIGMFTTGSLPAGWTRYSAMDDRVPRGSATPGTNGGAATHQHESTLDSNTGNESDHVHPFTTGGPSSTTTGGAAGLVAMWDHTHTGNTGGGSAHHHPMYAVLTSSAVSSWAPYRTVIFATKD